MTEKSKLFGYDGRWILTAFIQAGKLLLGMLRLAATGMGLLSATFHQRGVCYSPYYISNTLSCILVLVTHQMNRGFPWNKSTDGYLLHVILVSKSCWILQHFPKLLCVCVCVCIQVHWENYQQLGVSKTLSLLFLLCF